VRLGLALLLTAAGAVATPAEASSRPAPPEAQAPLVLPPDSRRRPDFDWLPAAERAEARRTLAAYDAKVAAAMRRADRAWTARGDKRARPVRPDLPPLPAVAGVSGPSRDTDGSRQLMAESPGYGGYQSDGLHLTDHPNDVYASDYQIWLDAPQENEVNECDYEGYSFECFWFYAMQYDTTTAGSAIHIGPVRGKDAGDSTWRMNVGGYNNGQPTGPKTTPAPDLPAGKWIRVRTWRTAYTATTGDFTVWAMWDGVDRQIATIRINGNAIAHSGFFSEIKEVDLTAQCSTDLVRAYFNRPIVHRDGRQFTFPVATTKYDPYCGNTNWRLLAAPDFVVHEREVPRTTPNGATLWNRTRLDYNWNALPHTRAGVDLRVTLRPRGWLAQPFVASKAMFDRVAFVAGCGYCIVDLHIWANREVNQHVCSKHGIQVLDNVFTTAIPDWNCFLTPGRYYYLQIYNTSWDKNATFYLVDDAGGNSADFAYVANAGTMPGSTALRSLIYTRDQ